MKKKIIVALIGGVCTIIAAIAGAVLGNNFGESHTMEKVNQSIGEVSGDNANITFNDIDDFIKDYQNVKISNDRFAKQLEEASEELEELKKQMGNTPIFKFKDLELSIDGEEIPIDPTKSMVTIDGRDYFDKSFVNNILGSNRELMIKEDGAYIGKVIKDKVNLTDKWLVDSTSGGYVKFQDSVTDSYGNLCVNAIEFSGEEAYAIFSLEEGYSLFKCRIALAEDVSSNITEQIIVKADNKVVYTSPELNKTKKPYIESDIPIKNCSLITIECHSDGYGKCIVSDASVYN